MEFYLQYRSRLWPEVGAIYDSVSPDFARALPPDAGMSGIPTVADIDGTLRIALALQPQARRILVVGGVSQFDEMQLRVARAALEPYRQRLEVEFLAGPSPQEAAARLAREDAETIVLYTSLFRDAAGQVYVPRDVVSTLGAASGAPIYGTFETYLGHGLLAGAMESFADHGQRVGDLVALALDGRLAGAPVVQPLVPSNCLVDGRQLERFGLNPRALPAGCEVRFVELPFLQRYAWQTAAVVLALLAQSALIAALLLQRRRRRAAEQSLQAQRAQLLHASRLAVAGELTAAIAHEINQPLTAILGNAEAAEMMAEAGRLSKEELLQILGDIRRDDLRASEVIRRLRTLAGRPRGRAAAIQASATPWSKPPRCCAPRHGGAHVTLEHSLQAQRSDLLGDPVQIQQVIINLCLNAFDASDAQPEDRRRVLLETSDTPAGVQLSVRDFGTGIEPADLSRVFDSFFTTKRSGMGLGLAIARSIVEAHGGTIVAVAHDIGAEFRLVLPTAPATVQPAPPANERAMTEPAVIHVVDDDDSVRQALQRLLVAAGHRVRTYASAGEFLLDPPRRCAGMPAAGPAHAGPVGAGPAGGAGTPRCAPAGDLPHRPWRPADRHPGDEGRGRRLPHQAGRAQAAARRRRPRAGARRRKAREPRRRGRPAGPVCPAHAA